MLSSSRDVQTINNKLAWANSGRRLGLSDSSDVWSLS